MSAKTKKQSDILIGDAQEQDFHDIQQIYASYVLHTTVTLEEVPPGVEEMQNRWRRSREKNLPYLIARIGGRIVGYAYAFPYRTRSAYRFTIEESVYVAKEFHGMGIGRRLLAAVIDSCRAGGFKQMVAIIGDADNMASIRVHQALGFTDAGILRSVGFKFGKWTDTVRMQKAL